MSIVYEFVLFRMRVPDAHKLPWEDRIVTVSENDLVENVVEKIHDVFVECGHSERNYLMWILNDEFATMSRQDRFGIRPIFDANVHGTKTIRAFIGELQRENKKYRRDNPSTIKRKHSNRIKLVVIIRS